MPEHGRSFSQNSHLRTEIIERHGLRRAFRHNDSSGKCITRTVLSATRLCARQSRLACLRKIFDSSELEEEHVSEVGADESCGNA